MADLVGVFAASHGPIIARDWEMMPAGHRASWRPRFDEIGRRLRACRPDVLVVISPDHWVNFFISNLPAVCIGIGDEHDGPPEPFMRKVFPRERLKGHAASAGICSTPRSTATSSPRCRTGSSSTMAPASRSGGSGSTLSCRSCP